MNKITPLVLAVALAAPAAAAPIAPAGSTSFYDFGSNDSVPAYLRDDFIGPRTEQQQAEYDASKQQQSFGVTDPCVPWRIPCKLPEENKPDLSKDGAVPNAPGENWVEHLDGSGNTVWNKCTPTMCEVQSQSCATSPNIPPCKAIEEQKKLAEKERLAKEQEKKNNSAYGWTGADGSGGKKSTGGGNEKSGRAPFGSMGLGGEGSAPNTGNNGAVAEDAGKRYGIFDDNGGEGLADNDAGSGSSPKSIVDDMENGAPNGSLFQPRPDGEKGLGDLGGVSALFNPTDNGNAVSVAGPGGGWSPTEKTSAIATVSGFQKPIPAQDNTIMGRVWTWMQRFDKAGAPTMRDDLVRPDYRNTNTFGTRPRNAAGPAPSDG